MRRTLSTALGAPLAVLLVLLLAGCGAEQGAADRTTAVGSEAATGATPGPNEGGSAQTPSDQPGGQRPTVGTGRATLVQPATGPSGGSSAATLPPREPPPPGTGVQVRLFDVHCPTGGSLVPCSMTVARGVVRVTGQGATDVVRAPTDRSGTAVVHTSAGTFEVGGRSRAGSCQPARAEVRAGHVVQLDLYCGDSPG